jgi:hypothetical protein
MSQVAVCILAKHFNTSTQRAIESALKHDLPVYLGLTHDPVDACVSTPHLHVLSVLWQDDFASARNAIIRYVTEQFILWIDSDEEIFSFPAIDWGNIQENILFHRKQYSSQVTPRLSAQMHRNHPGIFWKRKIHEYITTADAALYCTRFVSNLIIRHHGYEDQALVLKKHARNLGIAESTSEESKAYVENLVRLRAEVAHGKPNFFEWLACYREAKRTSNLHRVHSQCEYEAAVILCMAGYSRPAEACVKVNPVNILMQFALLTYEYLYLDKINESRLHFISECVTQGLYDPYEDFPHVLLGADKQTILNHAKTWSEEWRCGVVSPIDMASKSEHHVDNGAVFVQNKWVEVDHFDADLLLMNARTKKVVVLNHTSSILWSLLVKPISLFELTQILIQAFPLESKTSIDHAVRKFIGQLLNVGLIQMQMETVAFDTCE